MRAIHMAYVFSGSLLDQIPIFEACLGCVYSVDMCPRPNALRPIDNTDSVFRLRGGQNSAIAVIDLRSTYRPEMIFPLIFQEQIDLFYSRDLSCHSLIYLEEAILNVRRSR